MSFWFAMLCHEKILFMGRWLHSPDYGQAALFAVDMRSWLPEDHPAWRVLELTGELDLSAIAGAYRSDGQGQAPYDPAMMTALVVYCLLKGIRSSRKMERQCVDDVGCRVICGGRKGPSHNAFAVFRRRHQEALRDLFVQVLGIMAAEGAIEGHCAAVDGSPVEGAASRFGNLTAAQLDRRIAGAGEELAAAAAAWLEGTPVQPPLDGGGDDGDDDFPGSGAVPAGVPRKVSALAARLARLRQARAKAAAKAAVPGGPAAAAAAAAARAEKARAALAEAEARQDALMEQYQAVTAAGGKWRAGKPPVPKDKNARLCRQRARARRDLERARAAEKRAAEFLASRAKANPADPGTLLIPAKNGGGWVQGWNLQVAAARNQVLLYVGLHPAAVDAEALVPVVRAALAVLAEAARRPGAESLRDLVRAWLADAGYASAANFAALEDLLLLVAVTREAAQTGRRAATRDTPGEWKPMEARLATPGGKAAYKRRAAQVEPAFAQLFARFTRRLLCRGHEAAEAEAVLYGTVHNIAKLFAYRDRTAARGPAPAPA